MKKILLILLAVLSFFTTISTTINVSAENSADTSYNDDVDEYSDVLEDLMLASNFKQDNYKSISLEDFNVENDNSIQVIHLAESRSLELFIYTFQPLEDISYLATSINISFVPYSEYEIDYNNYILEMVSNNGYFYKYKVLNFRVDLNNVKERNYCISSIYRNFIEDIDSLQDKDNLINEKAISISKCFVYSDYLTSSDYIGNCFDIETIEITDKFCGYVRYVNGFYLLKETAVDSHFIAFDTDRVIDTLYRVKLSYVVHDITYNSRQNTQKSTKSYSNTIYLKNTEQVNIKKNGLFGRSFNFDRIQTIEDFKKGLNGTSVYGLGVLSDVFSPYYTIDVDKNDSFNNKKWVLNYLETSYMYQPVYGVNGFGYTYLENTFEYYSRVSNVTILELFFETDGEYYNLGVVDNKTTEYDKPVNTINENPSFKAILIAIVIVSLVVLLSYGIFLLFIHIV